ncbi:hypothetical protein [Gilvimarinus polysaccharolyticus]|uniref:hypothetical protein n=1 Tax=Gilvimarinus polysaccharolyticus TaxID=863921 RepID=UPI0006735A52|nr:hypothetical protein [Gilvimarinus polysaccharolyticus]
MKYLKQVGFLSLWFMLVGCEDNTEPAPKVSEPYVAPEPGYIKNPTFVIDGNDKVIDWGLLQHANNTSYTVSVDDAVLALTRVGEEPWGKVNQQFKKADIAPLLGKTLEFSIDIKGEFTDDSEQALEPPTISIMIKGLRAGTPGMMGSSTLFSKSEPVVEVMGVSPWRRYRIQFDMPDKQEVRGATLEISMVLTRHGTLWARAPALIEVP